MHQQLYDLLLAGHSMIVVAPPGTGGSTVISRLIRIRPWSDTAVQVPGGPFHSGKIKVAVVWCMDKLPSDQELETLNADQVIIKINVLPTTLSGTVRELCPGLVEFSKRLRSSADCWP